MLYLPNSYSKTRSSNKFFARKGTNFRERDKAILGYILILRKSTTTSYRLDLGYNVQLTVSNNKVNLVDF